MAIAEPDLSKRSLQLTVERTMAAAPAVLFRAWTEQFDRWFAAPGTVLMQGRVDTTECGPLCPMVCAKCTARSRSRLI